MDGINCGVFCILIDVWYRRGKQWGHVNMHDSYKQGDKKIMGEDEGDETIYFVCSTTCKNKQYNVGRKKSFAIKL